LKMDILYKNIHILKEENCFKTVGLEDNFGNEIRVQNNEQPINYYIELLKYIIDYILRYQPRIFPNQTIAYYSWILKFVESAPNEFSVWEAESKGIDYIEGVDYSIEILKSQRAVCLSHGVEPKFPKFDQKIVISKGIYE